MDVAHPTVILGSPRLLGVSDAAFATDPTSGRIVAWNSAAEELTGVSFDEALATTCGTLFDGVDDCGAPVCAVDCAFRGVDARGGAAAIGAAERLPGAGATWRPHPDIVVRTRSGRMRLVVMTVPGLIAGRPAMVHLIRPSLVPATL